MQDWETRQEIYFMQLIQRGFFISYLWWAMPFLQLLDCWQWMFNEWFSYMGKNVRNSLYKNVMYNRHLVHRQAMSYLMVKWIFPSARGLDLYDCPSTRVWSEACSAAKTIWKDEPHFVASQGSSDHRHKCVGQRHGKKLGKIFMVRYSESSVLMCVVK